MEKPLALSTAYATWVRGENDNKWIVRDQDGERLGEFPSHWKEKDCMTAIRTGRQFELIAFNTGIKFGKDTTVRAYKTIIEQLESQVKVLEQMNVGLSNKLERFIIGGK